ncbi:MAG: hypothetical protein VB091_12610 [Christensenella sp.]|nr:hypothetical protein [Christensenella sp.]
MIDCFWLPPLEECTNLAAWKIYEEHIYNIFYSDFIGDTPYYGKKEVRIRHRPYINGKEESFYHVTCKDFFHDRERNPDIRRCERIRWVRKFIENECDTSKCDKCEGVLIWEETSIERQCNKRIHILLPEEKYLVVLENRESFYLLITAHYLDRYGEVEKKVDKYRKWLENRKRPASGTQSEAPSTTGR